MHAQAQSSFTHLGQEALRRLHKPLCQFQHMPLLRPPFRRCLRPRPRLFPHHHRADLPSSSPVPLRLHVWANHLRPYERVIRPQALLSLLLWTLYALNSCMRPRAELAGAVGLSAAKWHRGVSASVRPWRGVFRSVSGFNTPRQGSHAFGTDE